MRRTFHEKDPLYEDDQEFSNGNASSEEESDFRQGGSRYKSRNSNHNSDDGASSNYLNTILSRTDLSPKTQQFMVKVYGNLAATSAAAALGSYLFISRVLPALGGLGFWLSIGLLFAIPTLRNRVGYRVRLAMLLGFGFLQGWEAGPLFSFFLNFQPETLMLGMIGTVVAFLSFSGTALFSARRSHLYLGGLLTTLTFVTLAFSFFPRFFDYNILLGLLTFCLYIIYDTQVIVERAEMGDRDDVQGAVRLFTDIFNVLVRLLIVLQRQQVTREERERRRKRGPS